MNRLALTLLTLGILLSSGCRSFTGSHFGLPFAGSCGDCYERQGHAAWAAGTPGGYGCEHVNCEQGVGCSGGPNCGMGASASPDCGVASVGGCCGDCSHGDCGSCAPVVQGGSAGAQGVGCPRCGLGLHAGATGCPRCGGALLGALRGRPTLLDHGATMCAGGGCGLSQGPTTGAVMYPYYTTRGPRDFLSANPPSIGP